MAMFVGQKQWHMDVVIGLNRLKIMMPDPGRTSHGLDLQGLSFQGLEK